MRPESGHRTAPNKSKAKQSCFKLLEPLPGPKNGHKNRPTFGRRGIHTKDWHKNRRSSTPDAHTPIEFAKTTAPQAEDQAPRRTRTPNQGAHDKNTKKPHDGHASHTPDNQCPRNTFFKHPALEHRRHIHKPCKTKIPVQVLRHCQCKQMWPCSRHVRLCFHRQT